MRNKNVELGFADKRDGAWLTNRYFPSKIGGKPAWLDVKNLPSAEDLACRVCVQPMSFVCQIYSPFEDEYNFHRMVYIFGCRNTECNKRNLPDNMKVFRSQLPLKNPFYDETPPDETGTPLPLIESPECKLCEVCGCKAVDSCEHCKNVHYCSSFHQKLHWTHKHRNDCKMSPSTSTSKKDDNEKTKTNSLTSLSLDNILLPEFEMVMEAIEDITARLSENSSSGEEDVYEDRRVREYRQIIACGPPLLQKVAAEELEKYLTPQIKEDSIFVKFRKVCTREPDQVLRYYKKGGDPLWISRPGQSLGHQLTEIPPCEFCNTQRTFEFQLMPQMLNYFEEDDIDWGTVLIYTCPNSCKLPDNKGYVLEHLLKQDIIE